MSTSYYVVDKKKLKEYQDFEEFWENRFKPGMKKMIEDYCSNAKGEYINQDSAEDIWYDISARLPYCPLDTDASETWIGAYSRTGGFLWNFADVDGAMIASPKDLSSFLASHPDFALQDENWKEISVEEFCSRTGLKKK